MGASISLPVHKNQDDMMMPKMLNLSTSGLRRSKRLQKSRMGTSFMTMMALFTGLVAMATQVTPMCFASQQMKCVQDISAKFDGTINNIHPLDFLVDSSTNDVFTLRRLCARMMLENSCKQCQIKFKPMKMENTGQFMKEVISQIILRQ